MVFCPRAGGPASGATWQDARHDRSTRPLARLRDAAGRRAAAGLRRSLRPRPDGLTDLASNDYLGLSGDPRLVEGAVAAAREWGTGSTGSRLVTGTTELHAELDRRLAAFTGSAAGLVFSSGFLANLGAVTALAGPDTLVVSDQVNHASIVDACRLSRSRVVIVPHRDAAAAERALAEREEDHALVVTDAVFSVDGDLAPLGALHAAVRAHGALLLVDEAHALGVVGDGGRGAAHAAGLAGEPDVVLTLTLSKSLASQGGAVLGAPEVIDALVDTGRSFIFDTGLNPPAAGAALAALDVLGSDPGLPGRAASGPWRSQTWRPVPAWKRPRPRRPWSPCSWASRRPRCGPPRSALSTVSASAASVRRRFPRAGPACASPHAPRWTSPTSHDCGRPWRKSPPLPAVVFTHNIGETGDEREEMP